MFYYQISADQVLLLITKGVIVSKILTFQKKKQGEQVEIYRKMKTKSEPDNEELQAKEERTSEA